MKVNTVIVKDVVKEIERRILTDFMDLLILSVLHHGGGQIGGYDIIRYLHRRFRFLPSSGTVYSHLYAMEREGLLRGKHNGRKRVYTLTQEGEEMAKIIFNAEDRIVRFMSIVLSPLRPPLFPLVSSKESSPEL